jgi:hypothetical protein
MEVEREQGDRQEEDRGHGSSSSSSSSVSSSSATVSWVHPRDPSLGDQFTSEIYGTDLYLVTKKSDPITGKRRVKCVVCADRGLLTASEWGNGKGLDGTTSLTYHAQHHHPNIPKVADYLSQCAEKKKLENDKKHAENQQFLKVLSCFHFVVSLNSFVFVISRKESKLGWKISFSVYLRKILYLVQCLVDFLNSSTIHQNTNC